MKNGFKTIVLAVALCVAAFAGELKDTANVFGPHAKYVATSIGNDPVWIETMMSTPPGGLKEYADRRVSEVTERGFYVVITTQPREWRVSMNPVGLASSEGVRLAGERMVAQFKRGEFSQGVTRLSRELLQLAGIAKPATPAVERTKAPPVEESYAVWYWVAGITGFVLLVVGCVWLSRRSARLERERREQWSAPKAPTPPVKPREEAKREEAQRMWDSYTPTERERMIERTTHHHHYSSGASTDPLMFYMLMNAASQPHVHVIQPSYEAPRYRAPDPSPEPERRRESSSDYSSPSSSYDSGGSSFDSGSSSSDSSGGGGSW